MTCDFNARWYVMQNMLYHVVFMIEDDFINRWDCCGEGGLAFLFLINYIILIGLIGFLLRFCIN